MSCRTLIRAASISKINLDSILLSGIVITYTCESSGDEWNIQDGDNGSNMLSFTSYQGYTTHKSYNILFKIF